MNIAIGAFMMLLGFLVMMHGMDASLARESHLIDLHLANGARYHMWANLPVSPAAGEEIVFGKHRLVVTESRAVMSSDKHIWAAAKSANTPRRKATKSAKRNWSSWDSSRTSRRSLIRMHQAQSCNLSVSNCPTVPWFFNRESTSRGR
jgi:hypothetical protein